MFRVFPEALDPCFAFCALPRSSPCNAYHCETYFCARSLAHFLFIHWGTTHCQGNERLLIQPPPWWPLQAICKYLQHQFANHGALPTESFNTLKPFHKWVDLCPMQCSKKFRFLWKLRVCSPKFCQALGGTQEDRFSYWWCPPVQQASYLAFRQISWKDRFSLMST